jgi:hypothetical protein
MLGSLGARALAGTTPSSFTAAFPAVNFVMVRGGINFRF